MIKIQLTATVFNPATEETRSGWVAASNPFELRELSTDVPEYEFETADEAGEFLNDFMGDTSPYTGEHDRATKLLHAAETVKNKETGEDWTYAALMDDGYYAK